MRSRRRMFLALSTGRLGMRPITPDGLPVLGYPDTWHGIYLACLHSGATLAPLVAKLGSREILEDVRLPELDAYRIERFARTMGLPGGL